MASVNASGISVVNKNTASLSIRNRSGRQIYKINSVDDGEITIVSAPPAHTIGSGSIVRDNGTVVYTEEKVWGVEFGARSTSARIASTPAGRDLDVEIGNNQTICTIPTSLVQNTPQLAVRHTGNRVVTGLSVGDLVVERNANSGSL